MNSNILIVMVYEIVGLMYELCGFFCLLTSIENIF